MNNYGIKDNSKRIFKIKNIVLKVGEYYTFYKEKTGIALNNSGEEAVYLLTPDNEIFFTLKYLDAKKRK